MREGSGRSIPRRRLLAPSGRPPGRWLASDPVRLQAGPQHEGTPEVHVLPAAGRNADGVHGALRHRVLAAHHGVPRRRRLLRRVHHLGRRRPAADVREPWQLLQRAYLTNRALAGVNLPLVFAGTSGVLPARNVNFLVWELVILLANKFSRDQIFNILGVIFKKRLEKLFFTASNTFWPLEKLNDFGNYFLGILGDALPLIFPNL